MKFQQLNFPHYTFRTRTTGDREEIFDDVRKKWVALTPEEWVRQHILRWLVEEKKYPASLMAVEKKITVNSLTRRCDVIANNTKGQPLLIVECKAPDVPLTQEVFDQAARYNSVVGADLFLLTNGIRHFCCRMDHAGQLWTFLRELPVYA